MILAFAIVLSTIPAFASVENQNAKINRIKNHLSKVKLDQGEISEMMDEEGFSYDQAKYYYYLDELMDYLVEEKITFNTKGLTPYSDKEIAANKKAFQNKVLDVDVRALMTAVAKANEIQDKFSEMKELIASYGENIPNELIIKDSDGSTIKYTSSNEKTRVVKAQNSEYNYSSENKLISDVLGMQEDIFYTGTFPSYDTYNGSSEVVYQDGVYYTKLRLETNTTYNSNGTSVNSADAYISRHGSITYSYLDDFERDYSSYDTGTAKVVWESNVTQTLGMDGGVVNISFSVTIGTSWTEELIHKYYDTGYYEKISKIYI